MMGKPSTHAEQPFQTAWLSTFVAGFIQDQRNRYHSSCRPLRPQHLERMAPHFSAQDLGRVRYRNIYPDRLPNPTFYAGLRAVGMEDLPDFSCRQSATFDQVIVTHEPFTPSLLFQELVHVVQYRLLGVEGFALLYVQALLAGDDCGSTPLDRCAQALQERFTNGEAAIDVEGEILRWLAADQAGVGAAASIRKDTTRPTWRNVFKARWQSCFAASRPALRASRTGSL